MSKTSEKEKPTFNLLIEELVTNIGGCGRYQWVVSFLIHFAKTCVSWSMIHMTFNGQEPSYMCLDMSEQSNSTTILQHEGTCDPVNYTCDTRVYSAEMKTIVNEWDLVCDRKWSVAMVTTIQMSGVLLGCFIAGILGDIIGRKPTYFLSLLIVIVFNIIAYFSISWEMYAVVRCGIGIGVGFYFSVQYNLMTEFMPTIWRPRAIAIPGWSIESGLYALAVWLLKDWKYVHLATAAVGLPFLLSFWFIQESSRWLITKQRYEDAETSINYIARVNGYDKPDVSKIISCAEEERQGEANTKNKASILDLVRTCSRARTTFVLIFICLSISYSYYGLLFGIGTLAGDLYLNIFISNIIEAPVNLSMFVFVNRFGRKASCFGFFFITAVFGLIVGVIQYVDTPVQGAITNIFAYGCKMTLAAGWASMIVYTTELYPTTVRNTAYGLHNTAARVGGMIAPQIVFLNDYVDGLLYFVAAAVMFISAFLWCQFPETKGQPLMDRYDIDSQTETSENGHVNSAFENKEIIIAWTSKDKSTARERDGLDNTRL